MGGWIIKRQMNEHIRFVTEWTDEDIYDQAGGQMDRQTDEQRVTLGSGGWTDRLLDGGMT